MTKEAHDVCNLALDCFMAILSERADESAPDLRSEHFSGLFEDEVSEVLRNASDYAEIRTATGEVYTWRYYNQVIRKDMYQERRSVCTIRSDELASILAHVDFTVLDF